MNGGCIESEQVPVSYCPFGDDVVVNQTLIDIALPSVQMTCSAVLDYVSSLNLFSLAYCATPTFRSVCCDTCKRKCGTNKILDIYFFVEFFHQLNF